MISNTGLAETKARVTNRKWKRIGWMGVGVLTCVCGVWLYRASNVPVVPNHQAAVSVRVSASDSNERVERGGASLIEAQRLVERSGGEEPRRETTFDWASRDPRAALDWVRKLPDDELKETAFEDLAKAWATISPREALEVLTVEFPDRLAEKAAAIVMSVWARNDFASAQQWIAGLAEGTVRSAAVLAAVREMADPREAVAWVEGFPEGESRDAGISAATQAWAIVDPAAALEWIEQAEIADVRLQNELVYSALVELLSRDAITASEWVKSLPVTPERDEVVRLLAHGLMEEYPEEALLWARAIQDEEARRRQSLLTLQHWLHADPNAARAKLHLSVGHGQLTHDPAMHMEMAELLSAAAAEQSALRY